MDDYLTTVNILTLASLAPNETIEITYTLDVASTFEDETDIINSVCLSTDGLTATDLDDLCSEVTTPKEQEDEVIVDKPEEVTTNLVVNKQLIADEDGDQLADTDEVLTYQVTVENESTVAVNNVVVIDTPDSQDTTGEITNVKVYD